ncbi:DNA polymerase III subunit beta [Prochlorococcus sp. MIT 1300]|uniref:DNA polymerase III subunit beta n=1 Tax=Prochlorococcus sp. MIT 1300 TaxID=3096218 RepID=UPI002A748A65|nr:DNA polymerase III subunit beta [Prochlorococcus sp. MIT 1300]
MKLVCSQLELNTALQLVNRAVATRPTHPVLANVLLTADAGTGRFSLTGYDLNLGIQTSISASVEDSGAITLPARIFGEIVSRFQSDSPITLLSDSDGEQVEITSLSGSYQMRGMNADDFPDLPLVQSGTTFKVHPNSLLNSLKRTLFASSSDDAKQLLTGVHFTFTDHSIEAAATDGHRLAVLSSSDAVLNETEQNQSDSFSVTLPSRSLREVERLISSWKPSEPISLFCDKGQVVFLVEDQVITSRTLEGSYPNYSQLIPDQFSRSIEIERLNFISSLERVAVLADQHNNVVKLSTAPDQGQLRISVDAQDLGSGSESIPANLKGDSIQIAFNVRYVLDGLKSMDDKIVKLNFNAPTTPAVFSPESDEGSFMYLVMPVQVRS